MSGVVLQAVVWIEAAKRLALCYVAVSSGTVATVLADRLHDTSASVVISSCALKQSVDSAIDELSAPLEPLVVLSSLDQRSSSSSSSSINNNNNDN